MDDPVPVVKDVKDVYYLDDLPGEEKRFAHLLSRFSEVYANKKPQFVARSPRPRQHHWRACRPSII